MGPNEIVTSDNADMIRGTSLTHRVWTKDSSEPGLRRYYENGRLMGSLVRGEVCYSAHRTGGRPVEFARSRTGLKAAVAYIMGAKA